MECFWPLPSIDLDQAEKWSTVVSATVATIALAVTVWVSVLQFRLGRRQVVLADQQAKSAAEQAAYAQESFALAMFEKRYLLYRQAKALHERCLRERRSPPPDLVKEAKDVLAEAEFLFDPDILGRLNEVFKHLDTIADYRRTGFADPSARERERQVIANLEDGIRLIREAMRLDLSLLPYERPHHIEKQFSFPPAVW
jgi:hypothetical protein